MSILPTIKKIIKRAFFTLSILIIVFLLLNRIFPLPDHVEYSTIITDNKGEVMHAFLTADDKWRMKTTLEEISPLLKKTIIEKEDKYFYSHPGINPLAMARAFLKNIISGRRTSGASTITMQVARALEPKKRTYLNKMMEVFRSFQLEIKYNKEEILQLYLNLIPYGGNIEGVKSAAVLYFNKNPDHLSLAEIMSLSIIPNRPSKLVIGKNNDRIEEERNRWLKRFADEKIFSEKEIQDALNEPLTASRLTVPRLAPQLSIKLKKQGGEIIPTAIDLSKQSNIEKLVRDYTNRLVPLNIRNAAVVVIDNRTGQVISYIGSSDFHDTADAGQVNGASAIRQPGSTLKPLLYALCIDEGILTPKSVLTDVAVNYDGYVPENYDRNLHGYVTMEYALDHSLNIPAVKAMRALGKNQLIKKLADCDFDQVKKDNQKLGLSMILGGCGASLEQLTGLFASFAHEGVYWRPLYRRDLLNKKKIRIVSKASTFMINETLSKINRPDFPLNWATTEHMPKIAWKTGTSYGRRDAWSIGYNKNFTVGVWVGNFSAAGIPELSGATIATPLLFRIFNMIDYDSDREWFNQPVDVEIRKVCSETGLIPGEHCEHIVSDYFIPLISSSISCNHLREIAVSADEKISYCKSCLPISDYKKKFYSYLPADIQEYYETHHIAYSKLPPHNPACEIVFNDGSPIITSPGNGSEYLLSRKGREPLQLSANTPNDVYKLYWYINDQFYKSSDARTKIFFVPREGPVKISCSDDKGRNRDVWITVRYVNL